MGTIAEIIRQGIYYRLALVVSALAYWIVYAFSSGMIFYYQQDVTKLVAQSGLGNPYFYFSSDSLLDFYLSGMIWYPSGHLQLNLLIGPTFFSILLSVLFSLQIAVSLFLLRRSRRVKSSASSIISIIPALFSGGCCSVPFGLIILGSLASSLGLYDFVFTYPYLTNSFFSALSFLILLLLLRSARKALAECRDCKL